MIIVFHDTYVDLTFRVLKFSSIHNKIKNDLRSLIVRSWQKRQGIRSIQYSLQFPTLLSKIFRKEQKQVIKYASMRRNRINILSKEQDGINRSFSKKSQSGSSIILRQSNSLQFQVYLQQQQQYYTLYILSNKNSQAIQPKPIIIFKKFDDLLVQGGIIIKVSFSFIQEITFGDGKFVTASLGLIILRIFQKIVCCEKGWKDELLLQFGLSSKAQSILSKSIEEIQKKTNYTQKIFITEKKQFTISSKFLIQIWIVVVYTGLYCD